VDSGNKRKTKLDRRKALALGGTALAASLVPGCGGDEEDVIAIADLPLEIASISSNDEF
jgi:hypothetical protein